MTLNIKGEEVTHDTESPLYASGVLKPEVHSRLVAEINRISNMTNVPVKYIANAAYNWLTPGELEIISGYPDWNARGIAGIVYLGTGVVHPKLLAMCGVLLRNFIDARFFTVSRLLETIKENYELREVSCLAVPDLYVTLQNGKSGLAPWQVAELYDLLQDRLSRGLVTLGHVDNIQRLKVDYGDSFAGLLQSYKAVNLKGMA